jgi:hypothetical protein
MESLARNTVAKACKRFRSLIEDPVLNLINRMVFSCDVSFKKIKLKFRIYRCHPV